MDKIGKFIYLIERAKFTVTRVHQQIETGESPFIKMERKPRKPLHLQYQHERRVRKA